MVRNKAFTLLELLVVVAIVAVLAGLMVPGVQSARESANRARCANNLRQIGLATLNYDATRGCFPDGGSNSKPGMFAQILPYVEQPNIKLAAPWKTKDAVAIYFCPSRRDATTVGGRALGDYSWPTRPLNSYFGWWSGDWSTAISPTEIPAWVPAGCPRIQPPSRTTIGDIRDGASNTILASEKCLGRPYYSGGTPGDDGGVYGGLDYDNARDIRQAPVMDKAQSEDYRFGSPHYSGVNAAMCDGSVRQFSFDISAKVWESLGTKAGGELSP